MERRGGGFQRTMRLLRCQSLCAVLPVLAERGQFSCVECCMFAQSLCFGTRASSGP